MSLRTKTQVSLRNDLIEAIDAVIQHGAKSGRYFGRGPVIEAVLEAAGIDPNDPDTFPEVNDTRNAGIVDVEERRARVQNQKYQAAIERRREAKEAAETRKPRMAVVLPEKEEEKTVPPQTSVASPEPVATPPTIEDKPAPTPNGNGLRPIEEVLDDLPTPMSEAKARSVLGLARTGAISRASLSKARRAARERGEPMADKAYAILSKGR